LVVRVEQFDAEHAAEPRSPALRREWLTGADGFDHFINGRDLLRAPKRGVWV
jgi:hypothetical protein